MGFIRLILFPVSLIYGAVMIIRNLLFDIRILRTYKSSIPVISVGNVTTGGTGKTPVVVMLTGLLLKAGKSVCVISRGYGRNTKALTVGFDGFASKAFPEQTGDELSMIINRFEENKGAFFAIADGKRVNAVKYAESNFKPDVIILDDAYQHRYIKRNLDIVVVSSEQSGIKDRTLLPAGNLREPLACLCRADLIIRNLKFAGKKNTYPLNTVPELYISYEAEGFYNTLGEQPDTGGRTFVSISGIADNRSFKNILKEKGYDTIHDYSFRDHHSYTSADTDEITRGRDADTVYLTTEKDFVKLKNFSNFTERNNLYFLKLKVRVDETALMSILKGKNIL